MKKLALIALVILGSCSKQEPSSFPSSTESSNPPRQSGYPRDFKDVLSADASVPISMKADYQLLINCQDNLAIRDGKEPLPMSIDRVADTVDALTKNPNAAAECSQFLNGNKPEQENTEESGRISRDSVMQEKGSTENQM